MAKRLLTEYTNAEEAEACEKKAFHRIACSGSNTRMAKCANKDCNQRVSKFRVQPAYCHKCTQKLKDNTCL